jgi:hypothetical protein
VGRVFQLVRLSVGHEQGGTLTGSLAAFGSAAPVGTCIGALLTGDGTVDHRPVRERIEEPSL